MFLVDEFDIEKLTAKGLDFDREKQYSPDFTIKPRHGNCLWEVNWIKDNLVHVWHTGVDEQLKTKIKRIGDTITMDEFTKLLENRQEVFAPLTLENLNTHALLIWLDMSDN